MEKKHNILKTMSTGDIRQLAVAVAFLFAVIGPLTLLMESEIIQGSWIRLLAMTFLSGGFSASIILARGNPFRLLFSVVVYISIIMTLSFVQFDALKPDVPALNVRPGVPFELSSEQLSDIEKKRKMFGLTAIFCLAVGYALFIRVIAKENRRRAEVEAEVKFAQQIHASLLPKSALKKNWCEIAGLSIPATQIGGDFFDIIALSDSKVLVVVADASGHGSGAGVLSAMTKSGIMQEILHTQSPADIMKNVNVMIHAVTEKNMFVTCALVLLDKTSNSAEIVTAGHPPVYCLRTYAFSELRTPNVALGMKRDAVFTSVKTQFHPGDRILLYSDGVLDTVNRSGDQFGPERLKSLFNTPSGTTTQEQVNDIMHGLRTFADQHDMQDDATVVMISISC